MANIDKENLKEILEEIHKLSARLRELEDKVVSILSTPEPVDNDEPVDMSMEAIGSFDVDIEPAVEEMAGAASTPYSADTAISSAAEKAEETAGEASTPYLADTAVSPAVEPEPVAEEPVEAEPEPVVEETVEAPVLKRQPSSPASLPWKRDTVGIRVKNIRSAISLMDRALFINTLFKQDVALYDQTIAELNLLEDFNDAVVYVEDHFPDWNLSSDPVYSFMMSVRKKLG